MNYRYINFSFAVLGIIMLVSCSNDNGIYPNDDQQEFKGEIATVYAKIGNMEKVDTRVVKYTDDKWSTNSFNTGDVVGFYSVSGIQSPTDPNSFTEAANNDKMYFEGASGSSYRFSNPDILINPQIVGGPSNYSFMYHPYYEDMPDVANSATIPGMPLRVLDDGIEKCIDFMQTQYNYSTSSSSYTTYYRIPLTSGVLQPTFYHYFSELVLQRGEGFKNAPDKRIWVVMKKPYNYIRIKRTTSNYTFSIYQLTDDPNEDPMVTLIDGEPKTRVNKYRVWQAWEGSVAGGNYYVIIPPDEVSYILIQDDNGVWQNVGDFYLSYSSSYTSKTARNGSKYTINIVLSGLNPVVKPVIVEDWNNGGTITDQSEAGINSYQDFLNWLALYNLYTDTRSDDLVERLTPYGDRIYNEATGRTSWTFYINNNIEFPNSVKDLQILHLDDTLVGSSVYANYRFTNLRSTLIGEIGEFGALKSLDFDDLYIIDVNGNSTSTGGLVTSLNGGWIDNCNINNGVVVSDKPSGILIGNAVRGKITNCNFSGQVIGLSTAEQPYYGIFGTNPNDGAMTFTGNSSPELYFETYY